MERSGSGSAWLGIKDRVLMYCVRRARKAPQHANANFVPTVSQLGDDERGHLSSMMREVQKGIAGGHAFRPLRTRLVLMHGVEEVDVRGQRRQTAARRLQNGRLLPSWPAINDWR
jgi:hypothetical protein